MPVTTFVRAVALAMLALGLAVAPAQASLLVYDFLVAPTSGPLGGQTLGGRFTYDSSIVPVGGSGIVTTGPGGSALRSFQLELGDTRFSAGNVSATLIFQNGALSRFRIGETGLGVPTDGTDYFFMDSLFGWGEYRLAGNSQLYGGALSAQLVNPQIDRYLISATPLTGPLAGQTANGSFAIDHAIAAPNTLLVDTDEQRQNLNALLDFQFALAGVDYTTANTGIERLGFDASGRVNELVIGPGRTVDLASSTDDFLMLRAPNGDSLFLYATLETGGIYSGGLSITPVNGPISTIIGSTTIFDIDTPQEGYTGSIQDLPPPGTPVPEPATLAVLTLGLAALATTRRRASTPPSIQ